MTTRENLNSKTGQLILAAMLLGTPGEAIFNKRAPRLFRAHLSGDVDTVYEGLNEFRTDLLEGLSISDVGEFAKEECLKILHSLDVAQPVITL